jgi:hypothetical protein
MTSPPLTNNVQATTMTQNPTLHRKVHEEIAKFEKQMDELRLMKSVSKDLKNYRKMITIKRND